MSVGVLLVHGLTGSPVEMRAVAGPLRNAGYDVVTPTLPGHGAGHKELLATDWKDWLSGLEKEYENLRSRCDQVFVVGLCASAVLAAVLAARKPDIAGLVLISSHYGEIHPGMPKTRYLLPLVYPFEFLRKRLYWTETAPYGIKDPRMQEMITTSLLAAKNNEGSEHGTFRTYVESFYQSELLVKVLKAEAHKVKCPVLLMHSLEDSWFTPENTLRLSGDLGTEDKTVLMFTGCNHVLTVDLRKDYVTQQIEEFIRAKTKAKAGGQSDSAAA